MKRVVIVPFADVDRFPDLEVIARDGALVALVGNTAAGRTRDAYDSEEAFLSAVALGLADRHTFNSLAEAAAFAIDPFRPVRSDTFLWSIALLLLPREVP